MTGIALLEQIPSPVAVASFDNPKTAIMNQETNSMFDSELAIHHSEEFFASDHLTGGIERRIMQAYVHLVFEPEGLGSIRTVTVGRFGALEARLTELPRDRLLMDVPPFWLEVFASADQTSIDSLGFFEFDDTEMVSAVELIVDAVRGEF